MPPDIPRRSNSNLRGRPPSDAAKPDSEAFNDAVQQVKSTGSVDAAARKLALYAKMTGGAGPSAPTPPAAPGVGPSAKGTDEKQGQRQGDDGDIEMASPTVNVRAVKASPIQGTFKRLSRPAAPTTTKATPAPPAAAAAAAPAASTSASAANAMPGKRDPCDDPEEQAYIAQKAQTQEQSSDENGNGAYMAEQDEYAVEDDDMDEDEDEPEVVHLQEIVEGLWVGDLVAAMDTEGLKARGISNILSLLRPKIQFTSDFAVFPLEIDDSPDTDILTHLPTCVAWIGEALRRRERARERLRRSSSQSIRRRASTSSNKSSRSPTFPLAENGSGDRDHLREATPPEERDVLIRHLPPTTPGGVLVHCQAGMSRSATTAAAYLMTALAIPPDAAVDIIRSKRPVVDPSQTFWHQLALFHSADGRVSLRDRETRQFYMERTTTKFMNRGGQPDISHMAKYPATPTASSPPTPTGSHGKRKIRCKMCRRHLAVREHMMDHILEQSPASRPRTPSIGQMSAAMTPIMPTQDAFGDGNGKGAGARERRASVVSDVINPLTGLPGARSRHPSMTSDRPALDSLSIHNSSSSLPGNNTSTGTATTQGSVPTPRSRSIDVTASGFGMTAMTSRSQSSQGYSSNGGKGVGGASDSANGGDGMMVDTPVNMTRSNSVDHRTSPSPSSSGFGATVRRKSSLSQMQSANDTVNARQYRSADQIYAHLPPQLAALRMAQNGGSSPGQEEPDDAMAVDGASPPSSPELDSHNSSTINPRSSGPNKAFPAHPQYPPNHPLAHLHAAQSAHSAHVPHGHKNEGARGAARRMSMLALTPTEGTSPGAQHGHALGGGAGSGANSPARERRGSGFGFGGEIATGGPPILVNNKCSGYFVEPLTWMEPVLASGQISGKLVCPNEKCGAKIGNYDWAGVQCGCKEWVTPGFCISRSKVDEVW